MGIIAISSVSHTPMRIVKTETRVARIPRVLVEKPVTTLSMVKMAIKFSPCMELDRDLAVGCNVSLLSSNMATLKFFIKLRAPVSIVFKPFLFSQSFFKLLKPANNFLKKVSPLLPQFFIYFFLIRF